MASRLIYRRWGNRECYSLRACASLLATSAHRSAAAVAFLLYNVEPVSRVHSPVPTTRLRGRAEASQCTVPHSSLVVEGALLAVSTLQPSPLMP